MRWTGSRTNILLVILLFLFVAIVIPGLPGFSEDTILFRKWAFYIHDQGLRKAYIGNDNPYSPAYQYILWLYGKLCGNEKLINDRIGYLRIFTLVAEMTGIYFVYRWTNRKMAFSMLLLLVLFNPGFSCNTFVWGQTDGIYAALLFMAIYYLHKQRFLPGLAAYAVALLFSAQAFIFAPVVALLLCTGMQKSAVTRWPAAVAVATVIAVALCSPFLGTAESRHFLTEAILGSNNVPAPAARQYAFNLYYWLFANSGDVIAYNDKDVFFAGISYAHAGGVLFLLSAALAIYPLLKAATAKIAGKDNATGFPQEKLWIICSLLPVLYFFFNTGARVQSAHAAIFFIVVYAFATGKRAVYVLFSIAYFLNTEHIMMWLKFTNYGTLLFDARFIALLYFIIILYLFACLFRQRKQVSSFQPINPLA